MRHMSCFWLPNTFKHPPNLGNIPLCQFHLFGIREVDTHLLNLLCSYSTGRYWHQYSDTPPGDISSEVRNMRTNLCMELPFYWRERLSAFSRSCGDKTKSLQVASVLAAGAVETASSCRQLCKAEGLVELLQWPYFSISQFHGVG